MEVHKMSPNIHEERIQFLQREIEAINCLIDDALYTADEIALDMYYHKKKRLQKELEELLENCNWSK